jgi:hypothetical protein
MRLKIGKNKKIITVVIIAIIILNACYSDKSEYKSLKLTFNQNFRVEDSIFQLKLCEYIKETNKYCKEKGKFKFWELFILHSTSNYVRAIVKKPNNELLSTATGYFNIDKDIFFIHTGLELLADKDTSFVYNIIRTNSDENYKILKEFKIPKRDTNLTREFILIADTILINP